MSCISYLNTCPAEGDLEANLLGKILQVLNEGGGGGVTSISINGGSAQTGAVSLTIPGGTVTSVNGDTGPAVSLDSGEIPEGANLYYTQARFDTAFSGKTTTNLTEGANLYFTNARAIGATLTAFAAAPGTVTAADTILTALQKVAAVTNNPLLNFTDETTDADGVMWRSAGTVETLRSIGATGFLQYNTLRMHNTAANLQLAICGGTSKSDGSYISLEGESAAANGSLGIAVKTTGNFHIISQPPASLTPTFRVVVDGNTGRIGLGPSLTPGFNLDINNSTTACVAKIYETTDGAAAPTNYSRLSFLTQAGNHQIRTESGGTGTLRILQIGTGPSNGSNIAGISTIIHGGQSTGSAAGGSILFQVSAAGGAGVSVNALATILTLASTGTITSTGDIACGASLTAVGLVRAGAGQSIHWSTRSVLRSSNDGLIELFNSGLSEFTRLNFGGTSNSFGSIGRDTVNGFTLQSAVGTATWNDASTAASGTVADRYLWGIAAPTLTSTNATVTYTRAASFYIGGAPAQSGNVSIGTAYALFIDAGTARFDGNLILSDIDIVLGTGAGTKIGTATSQKLAFYNANPIAQGASVADATGGTIIDVEARAAINALISRIEATGLIATV